MKLCGVSAAPVGGGFSEAPQRFGRGPWRRRRGPRPHGPRIALCCYVSHARARSRSDPSFPLTPRPEGTSPRRRRCGRGGLRCCDARAWAASCLRTRGWRHGAGETRPGLARSSRERSVYSHPTPTPAAIRMAGVPGGVTCRRPPGGQPLTRRPPLPEPAGSLLPGGELMGGWAQHPPAPSAGPTAGVRWRRETTAPPPGSPLGPLTLQAPGGARLPPAAAVAGATGIRVQVTCGFTQYPQWLPPPPSGRRGNAVPQ